MTGSDRNIASESTRAELLRSVRYESARKPKLRGAALVVPPPIPSIAAPQDAAEDPACDPVFDEAEPEEVGLRVLAALESMPSLEPDYCGDLFAEASVTIVERADSGGSDVEADPSYPESRGSLRARLHDVGDAPDIDPDEYAAYQGPIEEAVVEIIERPAGGQNAAYAERPDPEPPQRRSLMKALADGGE